jgi:hypothetical protein
LEHGLEVFAVADAGRGEKGSDERRGGGGVVGGVVEATGHDPVAAADDRQRVGEQPIGVERAGQRERAEARGIEWGEMGTS